MTQCEEVDRSGLLSLHIRCDVLPCVVSPYEWMAFCRGIESLNCFVIERCEMAVIEHVSEHPKSSRGILRLVRGQRRFSKEYLQNTREEFPNPAKLQRNRNSRNSPLGMWRRLR